MDQPHFTLDLAHSLHGRLRRFQVPHQLGYAVLALAFLGCFSVFGFVSSYMRMTWKVANYNSLRAEVETLRDRYQELQREARQTHHQLASFQLLASEVSLAYGLKRLEGPSSIASEGRLVPTVTETIEQYNFLKTAKLSRPLRSTPASFWLTDTMPSLWPVDGRLTSYFGHRSDPFSGMGAFHTGLDISVPSGTPIRATADGVVHQAEYHGQYGRLVVIGHGGGLQTYYAHLSKMEVVEGQEIRRGEIVGLCGATGRATSPHLHFEVRVNGTAVNPYPYLSRAGKMLRASATPFGAAMPTLLHF